jgi:hypothetical protein
MIYTINKSSDPHNGLNTTMRSLEKTGLTKHKIGGISSMDYVYEEIKHADLVIFGNYLPQEVYEWIQNLPSRVKIGYLFCSPLGQASCNGEISLFGHLLSMLEDRSHKLDYIFCSDKGISETFADKRIVFLPVVSDFEGIYTPIHKRSGILLIGNNLRAHRNFMNQLAAIKIAQRDFHVKEPVYSYMMAYEPFDYFQKMFGIDNWSNSVASITEEEKTRIVASSRLGLQVTYSDSFNIAAYEHAMCHVPCLVSNSLSWVPSSLCVKRNDSPRSIATSISEQIHASNQGQEQYGQNFRDVAKAEMELRYEICNRVLRSCI